MRRVGVVLVAAVLAGCGPKEVRHDTAVPEFLCDTQAGDEFSLDPMSTSPWTFVEVELGPYPVEVGTIDGELTFPEGYLCVCVGRPDAACRPACGQAPSVPFELRIKRGNDDFRPGSYVASIYYHSAVEQPPEGVSGNWQMLYQSECF